MRRFFIAFLSVACGGTSTTTTEAGSGSDASDASIVEEDGVDGSPNDQEAGDAPSDSMMPPATYNDLTNGGNWSSFSDPSAMVGFATPAFDGKYVYYAPQIGLGGGSAVHGKAIRFDTSGNFQSNVSWSSFDMTTLNSKAKGYLGTAFDGRYVYYAPLVTDNQAINTLVTRYDTTMAFTAGNSWSLYDVAPLDAHAGGFGGASFDGQYLYFIPFIPNQGYGSIVCRYDSKASFTSAGSWKTFDLSTKSAKAVAYLGSVFDGRYLYLVPNFSNGLVARFDTKGVFTDTNAWTLFDTTVVNASSHDFGGGTFDGRFVYFLSQNGGGALLTRYDTQGTFTNKAAWQTFDLLNWNPNVGGHFYGGVFDGRFVYAIPAGGSAIVRYDTQTSFTSGSSYHMFDLATSIKKATANYFGGAFDGEFLYLAAATPGMPMVRFDSKTPPSLPASYHGSFF